MATMTSKASTAINEAVKALQKETIELTKQEAKIVLWRDKKKEELDLQLQGVEDSRRKAHAAIDTAHNADKVRLEKDKKDLYRQAKAKLIEAGCHEPEKALSDNVMIKGLTEGAKGFIKKAITVGVRAYNGAAKWAADAQQEIEKEEQSA